ncbi:T9SS type A sorting domain-containing protein [Epilithonimonas hungarica]|uniref:T9SS type A sorting domain-containing protein n=1 Tax=Epilithonimonas hungarica TaxID=454006 RepID=UPI00351F9B49
MKGILFAVNFSIKKYYFRFHKTIKEVNISNLPKGNYLVKIKTDKENITQKIIKE